MMLRALPLLTGLLPIIAVFSSYWIAASYGNVPSCNPFLEGCTSVSATGRYPPASYLFKGAMLPQSIILSCYWLFNVVWLRALAASAGQVPKHAFTVGTLGVTGSLFLILYVTFLGSQEPFYEFMRRYGVYMYFLLNVLAQIVLASKVLPLARTLGMRRLVTLTTLQLVLGWFPFALGALNLTLKAVLEDSDAAENRIEWIFAMQMQLYFVVSYFSWKEAHFRASFEAGPTGTVSLKMDSSIPD